MAIRTGLFVFVVCLSFVLAVHESDREYPQFTPDVTHVHLVNIQGGEVNPLDLLPSIESDDSEAIALNLAEQALGFAVTYKVKNSYVSERSNVRHVYLKQTASDGREIFNANLNINIFNKRALNIGHSFYYGSTEALEGSLDSIGAITILLSFLKEGSGESVLSLVAPASGIELAHQVQGIIGSNKPANVRAGHVQVQNGALLEPVWDIEMDMGVHWWNAHVSMRSGDVLSVFDWVSDLNSYQIYPIGVNDPSDGNRTIVFNPAGNQPTGSPNGWTNTTGSNRTTIGNNVLAQSNPSGGTAWLNNPRPLATPAVDFLFNIDFTQQPSAYVNASTTNLFAWNNYIHDIFYNYGFNEVSGNFQDNNFGRGGLQNDAVQANCQDGGGTNNANFATPVDGQRPRMRMYIWTSSTPNRDGDLDQGIIIHEYAHGISTRLTGGPANSNCLGSGEAGGMGEGWGDFFATLIRQRANYTATQLFPMGAYSANNPLGIRKFPYTTLLSVNPETYAYINGAAYSGVHAKGEVWCGILWETYWNFVNDYGFNPNLYDSTSKSGNNMILNDVVSALKLQPCNPNFVQARDAILLADTINYGGANVCQLWRGFAKRGLGSMAVGGTTAQPVVKEDFTVPPNCS